MKTHGEGWFLEVPGKPLVRRELTLDDPRAGEAIVEVLACGLCHTDLAFASGAVAPKHALPLVLGHEIVGKVIACGDDGAKIGQSVIVPAVIPCGKCAFCGIGRGNACTAQKMPGNDINGGFATHVLVPSASVIAVTGAPETLDQRDLSVVADAVSTAQQAIRRSGLGAGDVAMVVGAGGVGSFVVQIARALGAHVIAIDVDPMRLETIARHGAETTIVSRDRPLKEVRKQVWMEAGKHALPTFRHRIFECSGHPDGQSLAFALIGQGSTMVQVGFSPKPVEVKLSALMAYDATVHGTWGAPAEAYAEVLPLVYAGKVVLAPFVQHEPMSRLNELLDDMAHHRLERRAVLDPRA
jgi:6-hydroxycyclohex-1-ene-1-carbonyl-CoA dehydrogenase